jgi:hypothetical protein
MNDKLENIAKFLMGDILRDEKNLFFDLIWIQFIYFVSI